MDKQWDKTFLDDLQYSESPKVKSYNQSDKRSRKDYFREYFQDEDNKERHKKAVYKSNAKHFVKNFATEHDMNELITIFNER